MTPLPALRNEPYADFARAKNQRAMEAARGGVRAACGRAHVPRVAGRPVLSGAWVRSVNPSQPAVVVGLQSRATPAPAAEAIADAAAFFPEWARTPVEDRAAIVLRAAALLRAQLRVQRLARARGGPELGQPAPGHPGAAPPTAGRTQRAHLPAPGRRGRDPALELPAGDSGGDDRRGAGVRQHGGAPAVERDAGYRGAVRRTAGRGRPAGSGGEIGDLLVPHPLTRLVNFTGSRDVGLRINELAARAALGLKWVRRVVAEMGGKDAIVVDADCDPDAAVAGWSLRRSAIRAGSVRPAAGRLRPVAFTRSWSAGSNRRWGALTVIRAAARRGILAYLEIGRGEGRPLTGGGAAPGDGCFLPPTVFTGVAPAARRFEEEIFGPVLAVTPAGDFAPALALANDSDYGLTGAVHAHVPAHLELTRCDVHVGNLHLNRQCPGAMVGAHPLGGFNPSGTQAKAGGPDYLLPFLQANSIATRLS